MSAMRDRLNTRLQPALVHALGMQKTPWPQLIATKLQRNVDFYQHMRLQYEPAFRNNIDRGCSRCSWTPHEMV